ncbi:MAG: hypothetical protein M1816_005622 [Peltula sp. TS41687]|nr:MAG: hypothetical protein M1816_005622 [Peltula sp. TS41687]
MAPDAMTDVGSDSTHTKTIQALQEEVDRLRIEVSTLRHVNEELTTQVGGYQNILDRVKARIEARAPTGPPRNHGHFRTTPGSYHGRSSSTFNSIDTYKKDNNVEWMRGNWLSSPANKQYLGEAEALFERSAYEPALTALKRLLAGQEIPIKVRIEAKLLMSVILRTWGNDPSQALAQAEDALQVAHSTEEIALASKAQFHRGLCYYHTDRYAEASWCFSLAAATKNHVEEIKPWIMMAEEARLSFPVNDPRRYLSICLEEIPPTDGIHEEYRSTPLSARTLV